MGEEGVGGGVEAVGEGDGHGGRDVGVAGLQVEVAVREAGGGGGGAIARVLQEGELHNNVMCAVQFVVCSAVWRSVCCWYTILCNCLSNVQSAIHC